MRDLRQGSGIFTGDRACRAFLLVLWGLFAFLLGGCGTNVPEATNRFVSREFGFEISVPQELAQAGWFIIPERELTFSHQYQPPDTSVFEPVAVVVPPTERASVLAPFFVDVFRLRNPSAAPKDLGDIRTGQVGEKLRSRRSLVINGESAEELVHGEGNRVMYETYLSRQGLGYAVHTLGAPDTSTTAIGFIIDVEVYRQVTQTFRFRE